MASLLRLVACLFVLLSFNAKALVINGCSIEENTQCIGANLSNEDLTTANLSFADLSGANLSNTNLTNANLYASNLKDTSLIGTNFTGANLYSSRFEGSSIDSSTIFNGADLSNATLSYRDLSGVSFSNIYSSQNLQFKGSVLDFTNFSDSMMRGGNGFSQASVRNSSFQNTLIQRPNGSLADFTNTNFSGARLERGSFYGAIMENTNFNSANIDSHFQHANLRNSIFTNTALGSSMFTNADLSGADFTGVTTYSMSNSAFENAIYSESTILPFDLDPTIRGMIFVSEVPLPAGIYLFLSGLVGLGLMRGRND